MGVNRKILYALLVAFSLVLGVFVFNNVEEESTSTPDFVDTPLYTGRNLIVGVIGEPPKIREKNVSYKTLTFGELKDFSTHLDFDAVFITEEHLSEASNQEYAKVYKTAGIPFFFIESKKSYLPFVSEELSYEEVPDLKSGMYATGYFQYGDKSQSWGYGLYNDKVNNKNIEDVYSRIFNTIESFS
jgi:hypothetical protein